MINRKELLERHNPQLTGCCKEAPLTVGNGELAFTADITGLQTLYQEYDILPLCTMSQWGWHTKPVSGERYAYTLRELTMTRYSFEGREVAYPKKKFPGNEEVYDWLRQNPHRLNLCRIGLQYQGEEISSSRLTDCRQMLELYTGTLDSVFCLDGVRCHVRTACHNQGRDQLAFVLDSEDLADGRLEAVVQFPYGAPDITASDWKAEDKHRTELVEQDAESVMLKRQLDRDSYFLEIKTDGDLEPLCDSHQVRIRAKGSHLEFTVALGAEAVEAEDPGRVFEAGREGWMRFWEKGGILRLNRSRDQRAEELERRIVLSQYLMAVNSCGSAPPQETGLTCNSWYGKMHLEMYLWHCAWLPLWNQTGLLERSLKWYQEHMGEARENAERNGYRGARWPKMIALQGIDSPSAVAPLLVWQQPHIIFMLELCYRQTKEKQFLEKYWQLVEETAVFMADYAVWDEERKRYDIKAPVIPVQECHSEVLTQNPAFEVEYWRIGLLIALQWAERLEKKPGEGWKHVAEHMAEMARKEGCYLAHDNCPETYGKFNRDHPSMLGAYGLLSSDRVDKEVMRKSLHRVVECWNYPTLWGWDFALMAMTAVRLGEPSLAIDLLLKDTPKNCYLANGHNSQVIRRDLPLYLPGNGSLLLAAAMMAAGYDGAETETPGFPKDGRWCVEYEGIEPLI